MEKKIMLVDDAAFMRMTIKNVLTKMGYTNLLEAADGAQAVEMYEKEHPDLVIMDITMPNMDGIQALQAIKAKDPRRQGDHVLCYGSGSHGCAGYQGRRYGLYCQAVQAGPYPADCHQDPGLIR